MTNPNNAPAPDHQQPSTNSTSPGASYTKGITPVGSNTFGLPSRGWRGGRAG
jgi:hypothetical protein